MSKKALIITEVFYPEDFIINNLTDDWREKGYQFEVLTRNPSYPFGKVSKGYKNNLYSKGNFKNTIIHRILVIPGYQKSLIVKILNYLSYFILSYFFLLIKGNKYNNVFIYQTGPLTNALSSVLLKWVFGFNITIWSQDLWPDTIYAYGLKKTKFAHFFLTGLVRFIFKRCDTILVSCNGFKSKIQDILKEEREIFWVPNWPLVNGFSDKKEYLSEGFNFTFAGNIGKVQNLDNIVRAFKNVSEKFPMAYLNIIGDGSYLQELKEICFNEGIQNVNFTGRKPLNKMGDFFAASQVLMISLVDVSLYEIMIPSKFQTYLTAKKPIYSIMNGEVSNMVRDYNIGLSALPGDLQAIESGFIKFLSLTNDELEDFSSNSVHLLQEQFDETKTKEKLENLFWNI